MLPSLLLSLYFVKVQGNSTNYFGRKEMLHFGVVKMYITHTDTYTHRQTYMLTHTYKQISQPTNLAISKNRFLWSLHLTVSTNLPEAVKFAGSHGMKKTF